ncbi:MAG: CCA tRNA nucleotidyltransferase [Wolbachia endosymbiont of Xenopsylla cheopis]
MQISQNWIANKEARLIIEAIEKSSGEIRFVGGCVRDSILEREVHDIDLATNLLPEQVIAALEASNITVIPTGLKHGTVTAVLNQQPFEITTLRHDIRCDGRHAEIEFTNSWQADASRRDFTFNALYADKYGNIYDYFDGLEDLRQRKLSFIGSPEARIKEDYLRILRAFRFHANICIGKISDEILSACSKHAEMISSLSGERIRDEMLKLLSCSDYLVPTLVSMQKCDVLQKIIPDKVSCNVLSHKILSEVDSIVKLALLLRTTVADRKSIGEYMSSFLRLSKKQKKKLMFILKNNISTDLSEKEQKRYICLFGLELYKDIIKICCIEAEKNVGEIQKYMLFADSCLIPDFPISGSDLQNIGYRQGKYLGESLKMVRNYWEASSYALTKDELLSYAKSLLSKKIEKIEYIAKKV